MAQSAKVDKSDMDNTFVRDIEENKSSKSIGKSTHQGRSDSQSAIDRSRRFKEKKDHIAALDEAEALEETQKLKEGLERQERVLSLSKERPKTGKS